MSDQTTGCDSCGAWKTIDNIYYVCQKPYDHLGMHYASVDGGKRIGEWDGGFVRNPLERVMRPVDEPLPPDPNPRRKYVYIAGPYRGRGGAHDYTAYFEIDQHINAALEAAAQLAVAGVGYFCPHQHSAHFEVITPSVPPEYWYELDMFFLEKCDALYLLPGWEDSSGSRAEYERAREIGMPIFMTIEGVLEWAQAVPFADPTTPVASRAQVH